jgi:hypothetical protein
MTASIAARDATGRSTVRPRVSCPRSASLASSVTVRSLAGPSPQDHTLAMNGSGP